MITRIWPEEFYRFVSMTFRLSSLNLAVPHRWTGGKSVYGPIAQVWTARASLALQAWDQNGQAMSAFLQSLGGQSGVMRIGDMSRRIPLRDRLLTPEAEAFSDATTFSDGTGFVSGYLSDFVTLHAAAVKGASFAVLTGLPVSEAAVLRPGDLFEMRPNGIPTEGPNLYQIRLNAPTDANGRTGITFDPPLRQAFAAGDMVVLKNPTSVFHFVDDAQGAFEVGLAGHCSSGFDLVEAVDLV